MNEDNKIKPQEETVQLNIDVNLDDKSLKQYDDGKIYVADISDNETLADYATKADLAVTDGLVENLSILANGNATDIGQLQQNKADKSSVAFTLDENLHGGFNGSGYNSMSGARIVSMDDAIDDKDAVNLKQLKTKQNKLIAGENITIQGDTISAVTTGSAFWIVGEFKWIDVDLAAPDGWVEISMPNGYGITQAANSGTTVGNLIVSLGQPTGSTRFWGVRNNDNSVPVIPSIGARLWTYRPTLYYQGFRKIKPENIELMVNKIRNNEDIKNYVEQYNNEIL